MQASTLHKNTPFAQCQQTTISDDLLEALITNKKRTDKYKHINPITSGGHDRDSFARQVLSFLLRRALGIIRIPGTYDIALRSEHFASLTIAEIDNACNEVKRIYDHTQSEMHRHASTIKLVRGIAGLEADVCAKLLDDVAGPDIHFYFQTITFFNHVLGAFSRQIKVSIDCPVSWIWASAYTLRDLELPGSDEEFMVVCQSADGTMSVPKSNFHITPSTHPINRVISRSHGGPRKSRDGLHAAISALMQEGFEPDDYERSIARYKFGKWESKLMLIGRKLDERGNPPSCGFVSLLTTKMH